MAKTKKFIIAVIFLIVNCTAYAQITTSAISGKITDASKESIIGATVQAVHVPSGAHYGTITNTEGRYTIQGMRAGGPYKITVSYVGYNTDIFNGIQLQLGATYPLNITLKESSEVLDEVMVLGKAGIDGTKTGAAMSFSSADIAKTPSISKSVADATRLNPMVSISQSGAMSFAGANNRYNSFQVDGAVNNDVFGLTSNGQNGGQAGTQPISMETIDQIQVSVAPFDVRQSGFTGGAINAITKSGTNKFHGAVYGDWLNQDLIGSKYTLMNGKDSQKYQDEKNYRYGATLGGAIIKDRLFFFANYEHANEEYPNAYGLGSDASKISADDAKTIYESLKKLGYKGSLNNPNNYTKSDKAGLKLDWSINDKHKAAFGWRMVNAKQLSGNSSASYLNASDYQYDFTSKTNTFTAELHSNFSSNLNNEFLASYVSVRDERSPYGISPMIQISNVGNGSLCFGTERSSTANALNQDIWSFTDNFTWYKGNHTLTFGAHGEYYKFGNLFIQDAYGTYYFNNISDFNMFANGQTIAETKDDKNNSIYYNTLNRYRFGTANTAVTGDPRWTPEFAAGQIGAYAQDKWNVNNNLELTYGLRIDFPLFFDTPTANEPFNKYAEEKGWGVKTNHKLSSNPMWSPRFGFRWNVNKDYNMVLRGGAGIFTGRIPFVWLSNNFSNTGIQLSTYDTKASTLMNADGEVLKQNLDANKKFDGTYTSTGKKGNLNNMSLIMGTDQSANISSLAASGYQTINVFSDDFKFSQNLRFDLALDFTLAGVDFTLEGIYSKNMNDIVYRDLAIDATGKSVADNYSSLSFDNRPMFSSITSGTTFSHIYELDNTSKGYSYNLSIQALKKFAFGLDLSASYTYSQSKSVNCGTSSVAQSNFNYNYTYQNPNSPELGYSAFNTPHQIKVSAFYHKDYAKNWNTTIGLIYTGNSGSPYSIYYNGDLNGDGSNGNDLLFIPTKDQLDKMSFKADKKYTVDQQKAAMNAWIENDDYLSKHRGEYYKRYCDNEKFEHHFDFHIAQTYKFKVAEEYHSVELSFDVLNIGNMFNKKWGRFNSTGSAVYYSPVTYSGNGQFQFLHDENYQMRSYSDYYSRWRGQIGLKYTF